VKMQHNRRAQIAAPWLIAAVLSACGGGSGDGLSPVSGAPQVEAPRDPQSPDSVGGGLTQPPAPEPTPGQTPAPAPAPAPGTPVISGTPGPDVLRASGAQPVTMVGGAGDDTYYVLHPDDRVIERPGEGIDLVITDLSHTLAPNVENLRVLGPMLNSVGGEPPTLVGNELDNHIVGAPFSYEEIHGLDGDDILDGGGRHGAYLDGGNGNDRLINSVGESRGGPGADTFVAAGRGGHTAPTAPITILDFNPGEGDRIEIWASRDEDSRALFAAGFLIFEADTQQLVYTTDPVGYATSPWLVEQIILLPGIARFEPEWVRVVAP
jgi:hypothetical protein